MLLEFKTPGDYANGVSRTYNRALSVISTTGYTVQVNSLNNDLTSTSNQSLPVNAIGLSVKDSQSQAVMGNVKLSSSKQSIITSLMPAKQKNILTLPIPLRQGISDFLIRHKNNIQGAYFQSYSTVEILNFFKKIISTILMVGITMCYAQKSAVSIETDQKLSVFNEDMVSILLKISNNTNIERNIDVDIQTVKGLRVINNISSIHLKANEKAFLPVKIFVEKRTSQRV